MRPSLLLAVLLSSVPVIVAGQDSKAKIEVYGFIMTDAGFNGTRQNPNWFDVVRPSQLPSFEDQFGPGSDVFFSVRQTRFGTRATIPTALGDVKTHFEFELMGVGVDAGQTTFRLRFAYAELGHFGVGQTWSPFADNEVYPAIVENWGPSGMAFFRNVQIRWMPIQGDSRLTFALERPGASGDEGVYADRVELQDVRARFPLPDLSAEYRRGGKWGYVELAGIVRYLKWDDLGNQPLDLAGDATGWGLNLSSNLKFAGSNTAKLNVVYGEGIENYMRDAPADVAVAPNPGGTVPIKGEALPILGVVAYLDHAWNKKFTTSVGYSMVDIDNTTLQTPAAFHRGQYASGNLLYTPVPGVMSGVELVWAHRDNHTDGFSSSTVRVQFSFRYNFSKTF
jgi:hypothetical protein